MDGERANPQVIAWGGYDKGKPRVRLLLESLRRQNALAAEINISVWSGIEDKSVAGRFRLLTAALRLLLFYPVVMLRLLRQPATHAILLPYPGIPDIFCVWAIAAARRQKIILDAFIPLHDTIVRDRALVAPDGAASKLIRAIERLALRRADVILVDTDEHGKFYAREYEVDPRRIITVLVGAEPLFRAPPRPADMAGAQRLSIPTDRPFVLFYGQLIPLHGLTMILRAVEMTEADPFHWVIVGKGQEEPLLRQFLEQRPRPNITWIPWVDYAQLPALVRRAAVALGVFGGSDKAARVIPNKLFQILAAGKPAITRDSPAVRELAERYPKTIITIPAGDGAELAKAVRRVLADPAALRPLPPHALDELGPDAGVSLLLERLGESL